MSQVAVEVAPMIDPLLNSSVPSNATTNGTEKRWDVKDFLIQFHCCSPVFPNDYGSVIRVLDTQSIGDAFKKMIDNRIMSIPIVDHVSGRPLFVISMLHFVEYILKLFSPNDFQDDLWHTITHLLNDKISHFHKDRVVQIPEKTNINLDPVYTVNEHDSLLDAVHLMNEKKIHRVIVTNKQGELVNIITQSRIMQFLNVNVDQLADASKTVEELQLGTKGVIWINENKTAYEAFLKMQREGLLALPVMNNMGRLVGNISVNDMKLIGFDGHYWNLLGKPLVEYLKELRARPESKIRSHVFALLQEDDQPPIVVKCKEKDNLAFVIRIINFYRVHRMYIVDDTMKPVGVISLSDVLRTVVH